MAVSTPIRRVILTANESKRKISEAQNTIKSVSEVIEKRTKVKREVFTQTSIFKKRRAENEKRKLLEDELEAPSVVVTPQGPQKLIEATGTTRGFFDRILGFIGYLAAGWLMNSLPTWIAIGKEFIARVQKAGQIISGFFNNTIELFTNVGKTFRAVGENLMQFDFFDTSNRVKDSMSELNGTMEKLTNEIQEAYELLTTPLTEGKYSGEEIPEVGTQYEDQGAYGETGETGQSMTATGGAKASPYIYSKFGPRKSPGGIGSTNHGGVDISGGPWQAGTPVSVIKPGVVVAAEDLGRRDWGKYVVIKHNDGTYTLYGHLSQINVSQGTKIENKSGAATVIGKVGSTGVSTGPHLHFELGNGWNGTIQNKIDPEPYIDDYVRGGGDVKVTQTASTAQPQQTLMGQPTPKGGTLTTAQLVSVAKQVGFNEKNAVIAAAVAKAESGGRSGVVNDNPRTGDLSYGLWQINMIGRLGPARLKQFGISSYEQLKDPLTNARAAFILSGGSNFTPWSVYKSGKYKSFLPEAQKAAGVAPSQYTSSKITSTTQAQVSSTTTSQSVPSALTPERRGQDIMITQPQQQQNIITPAASGGGAAPSPISDFDLLNNFIKNKLLLDLAYL
jgi:hypothetical protein